MKVPKPKEKEIQAACLAWLRLWGALPVRTNSGAVKVADRLVRFNHTPGCSDALVCLPGGRFAAIEFKRPGETPTPLQQGFLVDVHAAGGLALVVTSVDELRDQLEAVGYDVG